MVRVAINGYGRIGRNVHRQFVQMFPEDVDVVAVNASSSTEMRAYLLKYDSLHGKFDGEIKVIGDEEFTVNGSPVHVVKERTPEHCPWKDLNVDIVVESTGNFDIQETVQGHINAGAKKVLVTAPMKDDTPMFVMGVNDDHLTSNMHIISNASCTTNCIAPIIQVIDREYGIDYLLVSSVHAFTASQNIIDNKAREGNDFRRSRAATLSIIPTKTSAVKACAKIFPHLEGKIDGMAFRVPVPTVSCAYMAFTVSRKTTKEDINSKFMDAASSGSLKNILSICDEECVSIDFQTNPHSSIIDAPYTKVVNGRAVQILSWYDNEWGYAMRVTEMAVRLASFLS
jgi:glyceraldehyde 3-phosphate dehydrogenase